MISLVHSLIFVEWPIAPPEMHDWQGDLCARCETGLFDRDAERPCRGSKTMNGEAGDASGRKQFATIGHGAPKAAESPPVLAGCLVCGKRALVLPNGLCPHCNDEREKAEKMCLEEA